MTYNFPNQKKKYIRNPVILRPVTASHSRDKGANGQIKTRPATTVVTGNLPTKPAPDMETIRIDFWKFTDFSEVEQSDLEPFMMYLRSWAKQAAEKREYTDAKIARDMANCVQEHIKSLSYKERDVYANEMKEEEERIKILQEERIAKIEEKYQNELMSVTERQQLELDEFESSWSDKFPIYYRKPSSQVLNLHHIENAYVSLKDYDEAENTRNNMEALYDIECEQKQEQILAAYRNHRAQLVGKFEKELENVEDDHQDKLANANVLYLKDKAKVDNRKKILQLKEHKHALLALIVKQFIMEIILQLKKLFQ